MNFRFINKVKVDGDIYTIALNNNKNLLACAGTASHIELFSIINKQDFQHFQQLDSKNTLPILVLLFTKTNQLIQLGINKFINIYELSQGAYTCIKTIETQYITYQAYLFRNDSIIISVGDTNKLNITNIDSNISSQFTIPYYESLLNIHKKQQRALITYPGGKKMYNFDLLNERSYQIFLGNNASTRFSLSNNQYYFAIGTGKFIRIKYFFSKIKTLRTFDSIHGVSLMVIFMKDDKKIICGGMDCDLICYNFLSGDSFVKTTHLFEDIMNVEFLNNQVFITAQRTGSLGIWKEDNSLSFI